MLMCRVPVNHLIHSACSACLEFPACLDLAACLIAPLLYKSILLGVDAPLLYKGVLLGVDAKLLYKGIL